MTISKRERGVLGISAAAFEEVMEKYRDAARRRGVDLSQNVPRGTRLNEPGGQYRADEESWSPNPALRNKIPGRAYDVAIAYCRRLAAAAWPREEIEQIERLMIDPRYAQANKRKGHDLTPEEYIMLIDATWEAVKHAASALGRQV